MFCCENTLVWTQPFARVGKADASATNFCTTHFGRSARWLCHLTHEQRLTYSSAVRERLRNRAISARDAEAESKSLPSPHRSTPRKIVLPAKPTSLFIRFPGPMRVLSLPLFITPHLFALTRETTLFKTFACFVLC